MCGICGIVSVDEAVKVKVLQRMLKNLEHRGPDDWGIYIKDQGKFTNEEALQGKEGYLMIGNRRLSIIDLSKAGNQPMSNEDKRVWISHNGEIYNFREIRESLLVSGHKFKSNTDTEVILHLYEEYGEACVHHLRGMFAFAIWDEKRKRLFLARDRLGIKPLYYFYDGKQLLFASEIKALLATGLIEKELDSSGVLGFFSFGSVPSPYTIIKGIKALPAGHYIIFQEGKLKVKKYWEINFATDIQISEVEILETIRSILKESIKMRLISDVPLGAFLSGGIDSTAVVSLMREFATGPLRTFSITFPEVEFSEANYAKIAADRFGTEHTEYRVTGNSVIEELDRIIRAMDQPTVDGVNTYFVSKVTRESGTIVALSGLGGDELFCGYPGFKVLPRVERWIKRFNQAPLGLRKAMSIILQSGNSSIRRKKLAYLLSTTPSFQNLYFVSRALFLNNDLNKLMNQDYLRTTEKDRLFTPETYLEDSLKSCNTGKLTDIISFLELKTYMKNQLLRDTDVMSMTHSLEVRVPFLDHKLVEFMAKIPCRFKTGNDVPKRLLVRALNDKLPKEITHRKKQTFTFPFEVWLRREFRPFVEDIFSEKSLSRRNMLNSVEVKSLWSSFLSRPGKVHWSRIWALVVFELWCQEHIGS